MATPLNETRIDFTPNPTLYPFTSRWFESSVGPIHYIDEGRGRPLLLMHGNPDWSFLYHKMIPVLSDHFRCIAMDYPGFGLSVHPTDYSYLPSAHAKIVTEFVEHLDIRDALLLGQDWGGPIGMDVASRSADRFTGLIMGNTFAWPAGDRRQRVFSRVTGTRFMQQQIMNRNLIVKRIMKSLLQEPISDTAFDHYLRTAPTPQSRIGHAVFPAAIVREESWLAEVERRVADNLSDQPMLLLMGMKDRILTSKSFLAKWEAKWPHATWVKLPAAGHFFQEDAPVEAAAAIINKHAADEAVPPGR